MLRSTADDRRVRANRELLHQPNVGFSKWKTYLILLVRMGNKVGIDIYGFDPLKSRLVSKNRP